MADTLELECPSCKDMLEIDAAFAGGVCRCSNCGTLMTVPTDPTHERAERLTRPDRPDSPSGAASSPAKPTASQATPAAATPPASAPPAAPAEEVYTTASGKTVRVSDKRPIPTARKRKKALIKAGVLAAFLCAMALLLGIAGAAIYVMTRPASDSLDALANGADAPNPFTLTFPNLLGCVLESPCALVIDGSAQSQPWFDAFVRGLDASLKQTGPTHRVSVVLAAAGSPKAFPLDRPAPADDALRDMISQALTQHAPTGEPDLLPALQLALKRRPEHLVIVTSSTLTPEQADALLQALTRTPVLRADVLSFDSPADSLAPLTARFNGKIEQRTTKALKRWLTEAGVP